jgi:hypothetical protein
MVALSGIIGLWATAAPALAGIGGSGLAVKAQGERTGADLAVYGTLDRLELETGRLNVLGQTVKFGPGTLYTAGTTPLSPAQAASALEGEPGKLIAVYGEVAPDGSIKASEIDLSQNVAVAGSTQLFVRGIVKSINRTVASAHVGQLAIDYSAGLYEPVNDTLQAGSTVAFTGSLISSKLFAASVGISGIGGSGHAVTSGIGGSGLTTSGIGGSGLAVNGIGGSGRFVTNGIGGSGLTTNGIGGSGLAVNGIGGSGRFVTNGIGGSGLTTNGIGGSGLAVNGIGGSGRAVVTSGIGGSGLTTNGIGGSGLAVNGIGGSGRVVTSGIGGSGLTTSGIGGSGLAVNGIGGSGH